MSASLHLEPLPGSLRRACLFTEKTLGIWGLERLTDVASLVVAELVANGFEHAGTAVALDLQNSDGGVRISVRDGARIARENQKQRDKSTPPRGLSLVSALASDWGVEATETGKVVWAVIPEDLHDDEPAERRTYFSVNPRLRLRWEAWRRRRA